MPVFDAFAERGYEAASTRDIAARAGVTQGLVTYHFESKDALWQALPLMGFSASSRAPSRIARAEKARRADERPPGRPSEASSAWPPRIRRSSTSWSTLVEARLIA